MPGFELGKDGLAVIVVGVDGGDRAQNAAAWATGMARRERARLVLVHVEPLTSPAYWFPIGMATAAEAASEFVRELHQAAAGYLDAAGIRWELVHYRGDPAYGRRPSPRIAGRTASSSGGVTGCPGHSSPRRVVLSWWFPKVPS